MVITAQSLQNPSRTRDMFPCMTQVRFTPAQDALLRQVAEATGLKLSALIRNIVVVWASNHESAEGTVNVGELVAELQALEDEE